MVHDNGQLHNPNPHIPAREETQAGRIARREERIAHRDERHAVDDFDMVWRTVQTILRAVEPERGYCPTLDSFFNRKGGAVCLCDQTCTRSRGAG